MGKEDKQFWLLKTEPGEWSWEDQAANGGLSNWDGVKNKQAQKYLKSMKLSDLCFFYHSGSKARRVVGVVTVVKEWYEDGGGAVDVKAVGEMRRPVDLKEMKGDVGLKGFALFRQPRLSVVPVSEDVWERVCGLGGGFEGDGQDDQVQDDDGGNGGTLLEDMIASCNGKCNPIHHFSADESLRATNNFNPLCTIWKRKLLPWNDRPIIVKEFEGTIMEDEFRSFAIYDIVITSQMSNHMNVLKLLGCCLEFCVLLLVLENPIHGVVNDKGELANAITYLHTALSRPVIHRDIRHGSFFLDHYLVPKFCNFSLSKKIPPNLLHADDDVKGIYGYLDPNYDISGSVTEKSDVYCFGVLLLDGEQNFSIIENGKAHIQNDWFSKIFYSKILGEVVSKNQARQLKDFLALARTKGKHQGQI
ncbi:hypothetical protein ACJW30_07G085300 [Castanea mollissima]